MCILLLLLTLGQEPTETYSTVEHWTPTMELKLRIDCLNIIQSPSTVIQITLSYLLAVLVKRFLPAIKKILRELQNGGTYQSYDNLLPKFLQGRNFDSSSYLEFLS